MLASRDAGLIPEGMATRLAGERTIYDYARSEAYPLERVLDMADRASDRDAANVARFVAAFDDPHPVVRYWAATGCLVLGAKAEAAKAALLRRLSDDLADVRTIAAEATGGLGETEPALENTLAAVLVDGNRHEALAAQNSLDALRASGRVSLARVLDLVRDQKFAEPAESHPALLSNP